MFNPCLARVRRYQSVTNNKRTLVKVLLLVHNESFILNIVYLFTYLINNYNIICLFYKVSSKLQRNTSQPAGYDHLLKLLVIGDSGTIIQLK